MAKKTPAPSVAPDTPPGAQGDNAAQSSQEKPALPETKIVTLDAVLGETPDMPEVQEHALAAARERKAQEEVGEREAEAAQAPVKGKTDERGRPFDPAIHETGPDGGPIIGKKTGYIRMRRGGASGAAKPSRSRVNIASAADSVTASLDAGRNADVIKEKIASSAAVSAETIFILGQTIGGPEFAPEAAEREGLVAAWTHYYTVRGIVDIPPEVMIAVALGGYVMKRWNMPVFSEKRKGWMRAWKGEKAAERPETTP